ncbi:MAG: hypothetical protein ABSA45_04845 [Verrucomicrobiota bacterium]
MTSAVASGILPDVEGGIPPFAKWPFKFSMARELSAGLEATALRQAGCPPLRLLQRARM